MSRPIAAGEPETHRRAPAWAPLLVVGLALLVRWLYLQQADHVILFNEFTGDSAQYLELAGRLRAEGMAAPRGEAYFQAPLYPFFLLLAGATPDHLATARWLQFVGGALGALLAWDTARRLAGPTAALVAGLLAAVYGPRVFFDGEMLAIGWSVLFVQVLAWLLVIRLEPPRPGRRNPPAALDLATGVAGGLAALAQPNTLLASVAALAWILFAAPFADRRRAALLVAAGLLLVILPVTLRNKAQSGEWVPISANGGINFFIGNNPDADGTFHLPVGEPLLNDPNGLVVASREAASKALGRPAGPSAASAWWMNRGLAWWASAPLDAAALTARKVLYLLNNLEIPNHYDYAWFAGRVPILRLLPGFLLLLPLAAWGLLRTARSPAGRLFAVLLVALIASVAFFFVTDRYRLPMVAILFPLAGVGAVDLHGIARGRQPAARVPALLVVAAFVVLAAFPLIDTTASRAHMHNLVGTLHYRRDEPAAARREFEAAVALAPNLAEPVNNLGRLALNERDTKTAETWFRRAIEIDPRRPEAWFNLEELERGRRGWREALALLDRMTTEVPGAEASYGGAIAYRRGLSWEALGDTARAGESLRRAVRIKPDLAGAWGALGTMAAAAGRFTEARQLLEKSVRLSPDNFASLYNLALVTERTGDGPAALTLYRRVVALGGPEPELSRARERALALGRGAPAPSPTPGNRDTNR
jgi:tetratricopeptide (TPR) repeat protein